MKKITVKGGAPLVGTLDVSGSKNATLPILFATMVTGGVSRISGVPDIGDVAVAIRLLSSFGATVERRGHVLTVDTRNLTYTDPDPTLVSSIRASTYLIGACLSRFGIARILPFGGCNFSCRPIDIHLDSARALGASINDDVIVADRLKGANISLRLPSVGATVNTILMALLAKGESIIRGYAREPHVDDLIRFLRSAGADITVSPGAILVRPRALHGARHHVVGDMIEAGTYLVAAAATGGSVTLTDPPTDSLAAILASLSSLGADVRANAERVTVTSSSLRFTEVTTAPYPGFPTDLAPIVAPLLSLSGGKITDTVWRERFGYLSELRRFGIESALSENVATVYPSHSLPATVTAPDLRGGMALVIAALMTEGVSEIYSAQIILRGYERLGEKLRALGADVTVSDT